jgi:oligoribonuclease
VDRPGIAQIDEAVKLPGDPGPVETLRVVGEKRERLVWVDLEMTGLDPRTCHILEIAAVITELADLTPLERYHAVIHQPESVIAGADPVVQQMHARSGLWDRVRASTTSLEVAEDGALALVSRWCASHQGILAGNSVWQDRRFLFAYMSRFEAYLHYRQVDVSTLKVLAGAWFGPSAIPKKSERHTALEDVGESIAELEHYRQLMSKANADPARPRPTIRS